MFSNALRVCGELNSNHANASPSERNAHNEVLTITDSTLQTAELLTTTDTSVDDCHRQRELVLVHPEPLENSGVSILETSVGPDCAVQIALTHVPEEVPEKSSFLGDIESQDWHEVVDETLSVARTACIGALTVREFAPSSRTLGAIGAGTQARWQTRAIATVTSLSDVRVHSPSKSREACASDLTARGLPARLVETSGAAVDGVAEQWIQFNDS